MAKPIAFQRLEVPTKEMTRRTRLSRSYHFSLSREWKISRRVNGKKCISFLNMRGSWVSMYGHPPKGWGKTSVKHRTIASNEDSSWLARDEDVQNCILCFSFYTDVRSKNLFSHQHLPPVLSCLFRLESQESLIPRSLTSSGASPHSFTLLHHCAFARSERKDGTIFAGSAFNAPRWRTTMRWLSKLLVALATGKVPPGSTHTQSCVRELAGKKKTKCSCCCLVDFG